MSLNFDKPLVSKILKEAAVFICFTHATEIGQIKTVFSCIEQNWAIQQGKFFKTKKRKDEKIENVC